MSRSSVDEMLGEVERGGDISHAEKNGLKNMTQQYLVFTNLFFAT